MTTKTTVAVRKTTSAKRWLLVALGGLALGGAARALTAGGDPAQTKDLIAQIQKTDTSEGARARACQQLAIVGTPEAVPVLAGLLGDEKLGHYAREALEAMADPAADAALRSALANGAVRGDRLIGVVNSVGARGDAAATGALKEIANDATSPAAGAAWFALARIGTPDAIASVRAGLREAAPARRLAAAEAALAGAQRLAARGQRKEATELFDAVRSADVAGQAKLSSTRGAILARGEGGVALLLDALRATDAEMRNVALRALRELPGASVTSVVSAELPKLAPEVRALASAALADRGKGRAPTVAKAKAESLFNGRDLTGWDGDTTVWRVRAGTIVGGSLAGNPRNEFLATARTYKNFRLTVEYKLVGTEGFVNSGVQFRSVRIAQPPNEMSGYQADIGAGHSGCLYDESRRKKFLQRATDEQIKRLEKPGDWNRYEVRCEGAKVEIWLNGEKTVSYVEPDETVAREGLIALQIHGNNKAEVAFRELWIEELP